MLTFLPSIFHLPHHAQFLQKYLLGSPARYALSEKIKELIIPYFKLGASAYLSGFGCSEIAKNFSKKQALDQLNSTQHKAFNCSTTYLNMHGGLMLSSGYFSLIDALNEFGVISLGSLATAVCTAGSVLFLCANIIALEENVRLFNDLNETDWSQTNIDEQELRWLRQSAFWGILSNLGYIGATASLLFSGATPLALLVAVLSCFAGGIKILHDLSLWAKRHALF